MKVLFKSLFALYLLSIVSCNNNLYTNLQGEWQCMDDIQPHNFILFHKSGRYIVFNDLESQYPWMSIVEKGNWAINHNKIKLTDREFIETDASFRRYHGSDSILLMSVKKYSKRKLSLSFSESKKEHNKYTEHYKKVKRPAKMMQLYKNFSCRTETLILPEVGAAIILKLKYKFKICDGKSNILIIEDQDGNKLWEKQFVRTIKGTDEILLADKSGVEKFSQLIFKVNSSSGVPCHSWELKVKIY